MQINNNNNLLANFSFKNNFGNMMDKSPKNLSKIEEALQPIVSKYGTTDTHNFSRIANADETSMDKLQNAVIEEDDTLTALDFVDENGDGVDDVGDSMSSLTSLLDGITDEDDLANIQAELVALMDEIDKIAQNTFGAITEIANNSSGITTIDQNNYSLSIGNTDLEIEIMDMDSTSLGLRDIDITKEGGIDEAYEILSNAQESISNGLSYLSDVKEEIYNTFDEYKAEVEADILSQLKNYKGDDADDILESLKNAVLNRSDEVVIAQLNQQPESVVALIS